MILIISDRNDLSTIHICQWLHSWRVPFFRIDGEDDVYLERLSVRPDEAPQLILQCNGRRLAMDDIRCSWYRRGRLNLFCETVTAFPDPALNRIATAHLSSEVKILEQFFYHLLEKKPHIGTFSKGGMNKLAVLHEAVSLGIKIPQTYVTTSGKALADAPARMITKSISENINFSTAGNWYMTYTEEIAQSGLQESFFPSLFQELLEKEADLRIFYLCGEFYAMSIRSQENAQTEIDFRKYDDERPNRCVPFRLPDWLETKLHLLMQCVGLQTGSIDMVLTSDGEYVFLEVNPVGQFNMTSVPCNYNLEKRIAQKLCELALYETV